VISALCRRPIVIDRVEPAGKIFALTFVVDDELAVRVGALEADLDLAVGQMEGRFIAYALEGEGVVGQSEAVDFGKEEFVVDLVGRQKADTAPIESEPIQRCHAGDGMDPCVILFLSPNGEPAVERVDGRHIELAREELLAAISEPFFDFSFCSTVPYGRMGKDAAESGTDLDDFLGAID